MGKINLPNIVSKDTAEKLNLARHLIMNRQLNIQKLLKLSLNSLSYALKLKPWFYPSVMMIEPGNLCNLRCVGCKTGRRELKPSGFMKIEDFRKIVDEIKDTTFFVGLYIRGEPFLNPAIYDMINYLTLSRIAAFTSSNGHLFDTDEKAERLVRSGLYQLIISISGVSQETYERYHQGGDINKVKENLRRVVDMKRRLKMQTPVIKIRFLVMDHENELEVSKMKRLAEEVGADSTEIRYTIDEGNTAQSGPASSGDDSIAAKDFFHDVPLSVNACLWPWLISVVFWDGNVVPCCHTTKKMVHIGGNALEEGGFKAVWWGEGYNAFRRQIKQDKNRIPMCRDCMPQLGFQTNIFKKKDKDVNNASKLKA